MSEPQPSGVDMARAALAQARAAAKTRPTEPKRKPRRSASASSRHAGDPMGLGAAISRMMNDRGWEAPEPGGSIIDQWPTIAPELAGKVVAERFEHDTGILHLRPASPAYATQLRLYREKTLHRIQERTGSRAVRDLRILAPGTAPGAHAADTPGHLEQAAAADPAPVRTRDDGCPGYQQTRIAALAHRPTAPPADPYVVEAIARQEAALRAGRQPEPEHREAVWADDATPAGPAPGSVEESLARARAYARQQRAGGSVPGRVFDVV
ncbi:MULTISPECIES: DciA family protein [unclassified Streptomyces]|uniref:DciA family protein n=1 Tax=unclassified Streptomyces TaxID=2593676 RepID=UPI0036EC4DC5